MNSIVVIANSRYPKGTANSINVFRMAAAFRAMGHEVRLIAFRSCLISKKKLWQETCRRYGHHSDIKGNFLWWPFSRAAEPIMGLFIIFGLLLVNRKKLVYTRIRYVALLAAYMGFKTIYESHAPPRNSIDRNIELLFLQNPNSYVVLISNGLLNAYREKGLELYRYIITPDAGRTRHNCAPVQNGFSGICKNIGYIGSLFSGRGVNLLIELAFRMPSRCFHIIGNLETLSIPIGNLPKNLLLYDEFTPHQSEIITCLFDILLMPYQKDVRLDNNTNTASWMSPMKLFEYMLSGRPIISSNLPILHEVLRNLENSVLVEPDDADAWEKAIISLDNPEFRYKIAKLAFEEASLCYTWDKRAERILSFISRKTGSVNSHGLHILK